MVVNEKIYFEAYTNRQYTEHLYFILGRAELHWNFSSIPQDGSDVHRYSNSKWGSIMCTVGNL